MNDMISVATGFQYSVNIEYDLADDDKLKNFIPTTAALKLLEEILLSVRPNSSQRARILIGAYGRGKSHIVLTILALLMKKDLKLFEKLLPKLKSAPSLWSLVENFYAGSNKILPVIINGTATNLNQSFLSALQKTLADFGLANLMPETNFQAATKVLARWKKNFPKTYAAFKKSIREPINRFVARLENFDVDAYETFEKIYPDLTAGSAFNPFLGFGAVELYESVAKSLRAEGWSGIFVVYDEFSKFLEANIGRVSVSETKMLQDFAEKANRSGSAQMHLLLISHKEISNYIDTLPKEKVDGWRGVSDRFLHVRMTDDFSQTYDLISEVIRHDPTRWKSFLARHAAEFKALCEKSLASDIFRNEPNAVTQIVEGCFPLHPVSTFILPRLSERVAQNERTLFTFLSAEEIATLPTFLSKYRDDFTLIMPDKIFDYFAPIFGRELYGDEIHKIFLTANKILRKADISSLAAKIVKTIALIYMLEQFELLAPTKEQLAEIFSAEYSVNEIARTFDELIEKKFVVCLRQSNNFLKLKETSGVDVRQKIRDMTETFADDVSVCDELNAANFNDFMYPAGYNTEREMTRWFTFRFVDAEIFDATDFDGDGIIFGVLVDGDDALEEISRRLLTESRGKLQCIFVLPKKFVDVRDTVKKFAAVRKLKALAEDDATLFEEYELIFDDLQEVIKNFIDAYTRPELFRATYIYDGEILPLYRKAALIEQLSKICDKVFPDTPIVNNEVVNKNEISSVAANSRNKIVAGLLRRELEPNLGLRGNGQEVSIMRSTLIRTGILLDGEDPQINLQPDDFRMSNLLATIKSFVTAGGNFVELYNRLTAPEGKIGLRRGVIPIYLAAVLHNFLQEITIRDRFGDVRTNVDTLIQINVAPENFSLEYLAWNADKEIFVSRLAEVFADFSVDAAKNLGACDFVADAMRRWFLTLPKFAKELKSDSVDGRHVKFLKLLRQNLSGTELLLRRLPKLFSDNLDTTAEQVISAKKFFDGAVDALKLELVDETKILFASKATLPVTFRKWFASLNPKISEQLFDDGTDKFLRLIETSPADEKSFVTALAKLATGIRLEDWSEQTKSLCLDKIANFKSTAENFTPDVSGQRLIFVDEAGEKTVRHFETGELSARGKLLFNQITAALDAMGQAVSVQEKRQVLTEILRTLC